MKTVRNLIILFYSLFTFNLLVGCSNHNNLLNEHLSVNAATLAFLPTLTITPNHLEDILPSETDVKVSSTPIATPTVIVVKAVDAINEETEEVLERTETYSDELWHIAGEPVEAPILLYHHITPEDVVNDYFLSVDALKEQLDWIDEQGYTTITVSRLATAIKSGAYLPVHPILITFDDGYNDLYQYAYPILAEKNMVATVYLIGVCLDIEGCLRTSQVQELASAGWEFGSHSMTHQDLTTVDNLNYEMYQSRVYLEKMLGIELNTFAFPYGAGNEFIFRKSWQYGYIAAMGLGKSIVHYPWTLFYLNRIPILHGMKIDDLDAFLHPADQSTPTPSPK